MLFTVLGTYNTCCGSAVLPHYQTTTTVLQRIAESKGVLTGTAFKFPVVTFVVL